MLKKYLTKNEQGFTLVELLIVIIIMGILAGITINVINPAGLRAKSRDATRAADLKKIQASLELYFADNRAYPESRASGGWENLSAGSALLPGELSPNYINVLPLDPIGTDTAHTGPCNDFCIDTGANCRYNYRSDSTSYILTALMEVNTSDDDHKCRLLNNWATYGCGSAGATSTWDDSADDVCYGVENP